MRTVRLFLSWCHADEDPKNLLVSKLRQALASFADVEFEFWQDSQLVCGDDFGPAIGQRIQECDFGILLVTRGYHARPAIKKYELPFFVGPTATRGALPVALRRLDLDDDVSLGGIEQLQIFTLGGKSFEEVRAAQRTEFANKLATDIRRRVLDLNGWTAA